MGSDTVRCLTVNEVAEQLAISPQQVYRLMRSGQLPSIRVGTAGRRVTTKQLEQFIGAGGVAA